jgi:hypothetical protein
MEGCYINIRAFGHHLQLTKSMKFQILGKVEGQWRVKFSLSIKR